MIFLYVLAVWFSVGIAITIVFENYQPTLARWICAGIFWPLYFLH